MKPYAAASLALSLALGSTFGGAAVAQTPPHAHGGQAQGKAHTHGESKLNIAIDGNKVSIGLESPLDNLVGFEREPRTDAERKRVDAAVAKLRDAGTLFKIDPAAGCSQASVELTSPVLGVGVPAPMAAADGHADLDGDFAFDCQDASKARFIDVGLFQAFSGMKRIDVQIATPQGQAQRRLTRPNQRITLAR